MNEKHESILLLLKRFDYLSLKHIQAMVGFNSSQNTYRVMNQLKPYVSVFKDEGLNVYYLNKEGRAFTQSDKIRKKLTTAGHYLMRADLFLTLGCPDSWKNEIRIKYVYDENDPKSRHITVVADAHFVTETGKHYIVEIDNSQKMLKNKEKIEKYRRLIEKGIFKGIPVIVWVTTTPYRKQLLAELCEGLDVRIYLKGDLA